VVASEVLAPETTLMQTETTKLQSVSRRFIGRWRYDWRVRWFAKVDSRWVPMTATYKRLAGLDQCHTYRAQGAFEIMGIPVRRFNRRVSKRLQRRLRRRNSV